MRKCPGAIGGRGGGRGSYYKNIRILGKNMVCTKKNWDLVILNSNPLRTVELLSWSLALSLFGLFPSSFSLFFSPLKKKKIKINTEIAFSLLYSPHIFTHLIETWTQALIVACFDYRIQCLNWFPCLQLAPCTSRNSRMQIWPCHCSCFPTLRTQGGHFAFTSSALQAGPQPHTASGPILARSHWWVNKAWFLTVL